MALGVSPAFFGLSASGKIRKNQVRPRFPIVPVNTPQDYVPAGQHPIPPGKTANLM